MNYFVPVILAVVGYFFRDNKVVSYGAFGVAGILAFRQFTASKAAAASLDNAQQPGGAVAFGPKKPMTDLMMFRPQPPTMGEINQPVPKTIALGTSVGTSLKMRMIPKTGGTQFGSQALQSGAGNSGVVTKPNFAVKPTMTKGAKF